MNRPIRQMKDVTLEVFDDMRFSAVLRLYSELCEAQKEIKRLRCINSRLVERERERLGLPPKNLGKCQGSAELTCEALDAFTTSDTNQRS